MKKMMALVLCMACLWALAGCAAGGESSPRSVASVAGVREAALSQTPATSAPSKLGRRYTEDDIDTNILQTLSGHTSIILSPTYREDLEAIRNGAAPSEYEEQSIVYTLYYGYLNFMEASGLEDGYKEDATRLKLDILQEFCDRMGLGIDIMSLQAFARHVDPDNPEYTKWWAIIKWPPVLPRLEDERIEFLSDDTFVYSYKYYRVSPQPGDEEDFVEEYQGIWSNTFKIIEDSAYIPYQFVEGSYDPDGTDIAFCTILYKTTGEVDLYSGPGTEYGVLQQVPTDEYIYVDDRTLETGWVRVRTMSLWCAGWLSTEHIARNVLA